MLIPAVAISRVPADNLIVPGQRIGRRTLTITLDEFAQAAGRRWTRIPRRNSIAACCSLITAQRTSAHFYRTREELMVLRVSHIAKVSRTDRSVAVGSLLPDVVAAYGRPTVMTRLGDDFAGFVRVMYDDLGVAFRANLVTESVLSVSVFRRGMARSIWRF